MRFEAGGYEQRISGDGGATEERLSDDCGRCAGADSPQYSRDGRLIRPQNYREWIFRSSGLGMTYRLRGPESFLAQFL